MDFIQNAEEAYRAAGYSEVEAKAAANNQLLLPHLAQLRQVGAGLVDLATSYRQSGDETSAQAALQMAASLGQRIDQPESLTLIQTLVGNAIQQMSLKAMDPNSPYGNGGQTEQNQLDALLQEKLAFKAQAQQLEHIQQTMSEQDWINYSERMRLFGEQATIRWAIGKFGQP